MKTSTMLGIGLGGAVAIAFGVAVTRKPRNGNGNGNGGGGVIQPDGSGSSPGPLAPGQSSTVNWKGCKGTITHLATPDMMGNTYFWTVHRPTATTFTPAGALVGSGATKNNRVALDQMWAKLRAQMCQQTGTSVSGVPG
jgi:hypothetical protein